VKHYASLFGLPSHAKVALLTLGLCQIGAISTITLFAHAPVLLAVQFGLLLFLLSGASDLILGRFVLRSDPIYDVRRSSTLSMFSLLLWFGFLLVGSSLIALFGWWAFWVYAFLLGFAAVCILRSVVLLSTSFSSLWRVISSSLLQPVLSLVPMFYVALSVGQSFEIGQVGYVILAVSVSLATTFLFVHSVDKVGIAALGVPTTKILKAFLANWMEDLIAPVENLFEDFGKEGTIDFSLLAFKGERQVASILAVSSFHPGPFKNVGSSSLPNMIQEALEEKLRCVAAVPHGLFGHDFDLCSQQQNRKVLKAILESAAFERFSSKGTAFVRARKGVASASCQLFGDLAILCLTLAPETTEDFPKEIGDFILELAQKLGLAHVVIINAHNSIDGPFDISHSINDLKDASAAALEKASKQRPSTYEVGAARILPGGLRAEDGMGPGGICALLVRLRNQTYAYVIIDGNNMVSGMRERILAALERLGVDDGEILTTDTHIVNATVMTERGYHPLGEAISQQHLLRYIEQAVKEALSKMTPARASWRCGEVSDVNMIGEQQIREMPLLADEALQRAKHSALTLFAAAGAALVALLAAL
jgi:putative membrane protein